MPNRPLFIHFSFCFPLTLMFAVGVFVALAAGPRISAASPGALDAGSSTIYLPLITLSGQSSTIDRVAIIPGAALLTTVGETRLLAAHALAADGRPVPASFTWSSSDPSVISVDGNGLITANAGLGSAQITAQSGGKTATMIVMVAQPVAGAILVSDAQVAAPPQPVDPDASFSVGYHYTVTLQDVNTPPIGAVLLGSETMPIAGRVVAATPEGTQIVVTLEVVTLGEVFTQVSLNETVALTSLTIPPDVSEDFTVTQETDGRLTFTLRPGAAPFSGTPTGGDTPTTEFEVGPFACEIDGSVVQIELLAAEFSFQDQLTYDTVWNSSQQKIVVQGQPTLTISLKPSLQSELQGQLECKTKLVERVVPVPGPLGVFLGAVVEVGGGFSLEGVTPIVAGVSVEIKDELSGTFEAGFDCLNDVCQPVQRFDLAHSSEAETQTDVSLTPQVDRLELSATAFLYADLKAGVTIFRRIGAAAGQRKMELDLLGATVGAQLAGKFASEETQAADPTYVSEYGLSLDASIDVGRSINAFFDLVEMPAVNLDLATSLDLAHSPTASVLASQAQVQAGDVVTFTVHFVTDTITFPFVGYNIEAVRVYKKTLTGGLVLAGEIIPATEGQHEFVFPVVATEPVMVTERYVAFVQTTLLPLLRLDLGPVRAGLQFGTGTMDQAYDVVVDSTGNVMVVGETSGNLGGQSAGFQDAFVRKVGPGMENLWTHQFGTGSFDSARGVAVDADGNILVAGNTGGSIVGQNAGSIDSFVRKYDPNGSVLWTRQFGTTEIDGIEGTAVDADGNILVGGSTTGDLAAQNAGSYDGFVRKYDPNGNVLWTRQFGTIELESVRVVAVDSGGNALVAGYTNGNLGSQNFGGSDAFVYMFDADGNVLWTRQFGTTEIDSIEGAAVDADGNFLMAGYTTGNLAGQNAGSFDGFVIKVDANGNTLWAHQFGTMASDLVNDMTLDSAGNILLAGQTEGNLSGQNAGQNDAFVQKYNPSGSVLWTVQFGTEASDTAYSVAADAGGNVAVTGRTDGNLFGSNAGLSDVFLRVFTPDGE